jgi:hypothetical protein
VGRRLPGRRPGPPALEYRSRYLYRGVVAEANIVAEQNGSVTFRYVVGATGETGYRTLPGEDFLWLILQHVLPECSGVEFSG